MNVPHPEAGGHRGPNDVQAGSTSRDRCGDRLLRRVAGKHLRLDSEGFRKSPAGTSPRAPGSLGREPTRHSRPLKGRKASWNEQRGGFVRRSRGQPFESRGVSHDEFDVLVATHHGEIYTYLVLVTGRVSDAHDLSQRTFLRALETRRSLGLGAFARLRLFGI